MDKKNYKKYMTGIVLVGIIAAERGFVHEQLFDELGDRIHLPEKPSHNLILSDIYMCRSAIGATATAVTVDPGLIYEAWLYRNHK